MRGGARIHVVVLRILGVLLLVAAVLKGHQLLTQPLAGDSIWNNRLFLVAQIEFELALGIWWFSGLLQKAAWFAALVCVAIFSLVASRSHRESLNNGPESLRSLIVEFLAPLPSWPDLAATARLVVVVTRSLLALNEPARVASPSPMRLSSLDTILERIAQDTGRTETLSLLSSTIRLAGWPWN